MPDISKCVGKDCQVRENCYRYTSPDSYRQAYSGFEQSPEFSMVTGCDHFWTNKQGEL